jgi:hypothetical protein
MGTCFVIQPFDQGRFDKRFEDTFQPAIIAAGLEPYRVDRDPASLVPITDIEDGIRRADACFAEITTDNPNVWFELGFAIAARKPVVMVCAEERQRFPFDVQHRSIIRYSTESPRDFAEVGMKITKRLSAALETYRRVESIEEMSPTALSEGLTPHELTALITVAAAAVDGDPVASYVLRQEMNRAGYTDVACALAVRGLERKQYIARSQGYDGNNEYWGFIASDSGLDWLDSHQEQLKLKSAPDFDPPEDDLPF